MCKPNYEDREEGKAWLEVRNGLTVTEVVEFGDSTAKWLYDYGKGKGLTVLEAVLTNPEQLKAAKALLEDVISYMADEAGCLIRKRLTETKYPE